MPAERLVVIGGVAAGMSAASRARRINPRMEIIVLEKGDYVSYGTCGLTHFISGEVRRAEDLIVYTPEHFRRERGIDVRTGHEAVEIVPGRKSVDVRRGTETFPLKYDKLVLATGGAPAESLPGSGRPGVFACNHLGQAIALRHYLEATRPRRGVVIGGGYIGLEVAEALCKRGLRVTVLERSAGLLEEMEPEIIEKVQERLAAHQIKVELNAAVHSVEAGTESALSVLFGERGVLPADVVVTAMGVAPRAKLGEQAGAHLGRSGALWTDERQQTSLPSIYAAGDCAETLHLVSRQPTYLPLGTTANKQGRVAGENAAGGNAVFPGIVGTLVTKVFGLEVARTGLSVAAARAAGFVPESVTVKSFSRAKYLGGKPLWVKLIAELSTGRLLGGQLVGEEGAARRVDIVATALTAGLSLAEFVHLDLGYAPPFGPVYDPLLVAAWEALKKIGRRL